MSTFKEQLTGSLALQMTEQVKDLTPMQMIQVAFNAAIEQGKGLEVIDRILEQQKWMIQHDEEERFNTTLKRIQKQLKKIPKRGWNESTKSNFALAIDVDDAIQHLLDEEGMTLSFRPAESKRENEVLVIGTLSLGAYSKEYPLPMPADGKGPQGGGVMSRTHATGSAITYGKRYLKDMIFDLRFQDPKYRSLEDDGNSAGNGGVSDALKELIDQIELSATFPDAKEAYGKAFAEARRVGSEKATLQAIDAFEKAKGDFAK